MLISIAISEFNFSLKNQIIKAAGKKVHEDTSSGCCGGGLVVDATQFDPDFEVLDVVPTSVDPTAAIHITKVLSRSLDLVAKERLLHIVEGLLNPSSTRLVYLVLL